jgi:putative membrane protein
VGEMMGFGMGFGILGLLIMLLFWGGIIFLAVWFVKAIFSNNSNHNSSTNQRSDAPEILAQRYARGEITREQYEIMKRDIS